MKRICTFLSLVPAVALAASPKVSTPTFAFDSATGVATISYVLSDATAIVTFDVLTNGVSIGAENYVGAFGDVWKRVPAGEATRTISWRPRQSWAGTIADAANAGTLKVEVKANALDDPPLYMVANLSTSSNVFFYTDEKLLPGGKGVQDGRYKTDWLVMRRIPAAGVTWRMGKAAYQSPSNRDYPCTVTLSADNYAAVFETTREQLWWVTYGYGNSFTFNVDYQALENLTFDNLRGAAYDFPKDGHVVAADSVIGQLRTRTGLELDLPTDAQWEYACRAGTGTLFNNGTDDTSVSNIKTFAWTSATLEDAPTDLRPLPVGLLQPNAWGLYDMHGNVWERCLDWCQNVLSGDHVDLVGPETNPGTGKIHRGSSYSQGGSWQNFLPSSHRNYGNRDGTKTGFRLFCPAVIPDLPVASE